MLTQNSLLPKVIIGTAQFGLNYGITNRSGVLPANEAHRIMRLASESGIVRLDTAQAYGASEDVIGSFTEARFEVLTKIGALPGSELDWVDWLSSRIKSSMADLHEHTVTTVSFHDVGIFLNQGRDLAIRTLEVISSKFPDLVFGASIYDPDEWERLRDIQQLRVFQVPHSVFDRRFSQSGALEEMSRMGKSVHVRSVLLQGLLLIDPAALPETLAPWASTIETWQEYCIEQAVSPVGAAVKFALANPLVDGAVVGFDSVEHLHELITGLRSIPENALYYPDFGNLPADLIDPRRWIRV